MDKKILDLIACPICKGELVSVEPQKELICKFDRLAYPIRNGIPVLLENEARSITLEEKEQLK